MAKKDKSKLTSKISKLAKDGNKLKELVIKKQLKHALEENIKIKKKEKNLQLTATHFSQHFNAL